jgi:hypothetical protein
MNQPQPLTPTQLKLIPRGAPSPLPLVEQLEAAVVVLNRLGLTAAAKYMSSQLYRLLSRVRSPSNGPDYHYGDATMKGERYVPVDWPPDDDVEASDKLETILASQYDPKDLAELPELTEDQLKSGNYMTTARAFCKLGFQLYFDMDTGKYCYDPDEVVPVRYLLLLLDQMEDAIPVLNRLGLTLVADFLARQLRPRPGE